MMNNLIFFPRLTIGKFYVWHTITNETHYGRLMEKRGNWLQFYSYDDDRDKAWDGFMFVNKAHIKNIQLSKKTPKSNYYDVPKKSLKKKSFKKICEDGIICEIIGKVQGNESNLLEDFGDIFWINNEFQFFPIKPNGKYEKGYLPMQETQIVSIHYDDVYSNYLKKIAIEEE